ncbi:MAG: hypothetical protein JKY53_06960 [Flavobacteriales bacterium]|nr:hypothetical protein [Flavobacteriales bacterium]
MKEIQLLSFNVPEFEQLITQILRAELNKHSIPTEKERNDEYLTRKQVAKALHVSIDNVMLTPFKFQTVNPTFYDTIP